MTKISDLDKLLQKFIDGGLPGCALQIARKGDTVYEGYFGCTDIITREPVTNQSIFRMASMSKLPLYVTLMMLFERGKFLMNDPISKYLPEWKNSRKYVKDPVGYVKAVPTDGPVTVRDVLSMKCGLPYCNFPGPTDNHTLRAMQIKMQPFWDRGYYTLQEQVAAMADVPQAFEPGTHWLYGFSSEIAAALIEVLCEKGIDEVFKEFLFDPLGMDETRSRYFGDIRQRMVKLYQKDNDGTLKIGTSLLDEKHEPGADHDAGWARLFSTPSDFTKLMQMLANGGNYNGVQIMGRKTIDMMRYDGLNEAHRKDFDNLYNAGYGYGYGVRTLIDKQKGNHNGSLGAFGWTGGFGTWCEADPSEGISIVYMHNMMPNEEEYYHLRMRNAAYGIIQ